MAIWEIDSLENTPGERDENGKWLTSVSKFMNIKNEILTVNTQYYLLYFLNRLNEELIMFVHDLEK